MNQYPKRIYPRGAHNPGVTVNSAEDEARLMGAKREAPKAVEAPAPAAPAQQAAPASKPLTKAQQKAAAKAEAKKQQK